MDQARGLIAGFRSVRQRSEDLLKEIRRIKRDIEENESQTEILARLARPTLDTDLSEKEDSVSDLITEFNKFVTLLSSLPGNKSYESFLNVIFKSGESSLNTVIINCDFAIGLLEDKISPISQEQRNRVHDLRELLAKLSPEINDSVLEGNILAAMDEYEAGHALASLLISGRVVNYLIDQIPREDKNNKDITTEKIKYLKKAGIIDDKDRDTKELLIRAAKESRQEGSHGIGLPPSLIADAQSLLSDSVRILERVSIKLKNQNKSA